MKYMVKNYRKGESVFYRKTMPAHPPDKQEKATQTVEALCKEWAV